MTFKCVQLISNGYISNAIRLKWMIGTAPPLPHTSKYCIISGSVALRASKLKLFQEDKISSAVCVLAGQMMAKNPKTLSDASFLNRSLK